MSSQAGLQRAGQPFAGARGALASLPLSRIAGLQRAASPLPEREVPSLFSPFQGGWGIMTFK